MTKQTQIQIQNAKCEKLQLFVSNIKVRDITPIIA